MKNRFIRTAQKPLARTVNASWFPNSLKGDKTTTATKAPKTTMTTATTTPREVTAQTKPNFTKHKNKENTNKCRGRRKRRCMKARQGKYSGRRNG